MSVPVSKDHGKYESFSISTVYGRICSSSEYRKGIEDGCECAFLLSMEKYRKRQNKSLLFSRFRSFQTFLSAGFLSLQFGEITRIHSAVDELMTTIKIRPPRFAYLFCTAIKKTHGTLAILCTLRVCIRKHSLARI